MGNRLLLSLFRLIARLPLPILQGLGLLAGWVAFLVPNRVRAVTRINLDLCFPELTPGQRRRLLRRSLEETGKSLFEMPALWLGNPSAWAERVEDGEAWQQVQGVLARGKGVLLACPHLGNWEVGALFLAARGKFSTLYRPARHPVMDEMIRIGRTKGGTNALPITTQGIRQLYEALQRGEMVAILPDQQPKEVGGAAGVFAPFFGEPAYTMVLLGRIARRTGAPVLLLFFERLPWARGYTMRIVEAEPEIADSNPNVAAAALNRGVEKCVRLCPEQYQWTYKRFAARPDGGRSRYKRSRRT